MRGISAKKQADTSLNAKSSTFLVDIVVSRYNCRADLLGRTFTGIIQAVRLFVKSNRALTAAFDLTNHSNYAKILEMAH